MENGAAVKISERSKALFIAYAADAPNWSGTPLVGGNVGGSRQDRGNITQLKKAGLIETFEERRPIDSGISRLTWINFTERGIDFARQNGYDPQYGKIGPQTNTTKGETTMATKKKSNATPKSNETPTAAPAEPISGDGFTVETREQVERAATRKAPPAMTPMHDAIVATLGTNQWVTVPIPSGQTGKAFSRTVRATLLKNGYRQKLSIRRVISPTSVRFWVEEFKA